MPGSATITGLRNDFGQDSKDTFCRSNPFRQLGAPFQDVLTDTLSLARQLNGSIGRTFKLDGYLFHDICILIGYRLIHISPLGGPRPVASVENALHLGLMSFMTTFMAGLDRKIPHPRLLSELARAAIQKYRDEDPETQELLLWISFMHAVTIFRQAHNLWLISRITEISLDLGLHTWDDACRTLFKFPWVKSLHNKPGEAIWKISRIHSIISPVSQNHTPASTTDLR